jgi:hypothetical protein
MTTTPQMFNVVDDLQYAQLGDRRLRFRLRIIASRLQNAPGLSLPKVFQDPSQLEAAYRFFDNQRVSPEAILEPHLFMTAVRAATRGLYKQAVLVIHDTTSVEVPGGAWDMGTVDPGSKPGFYLHTSLCVGSDGEPLGVLFQHLWHRTGDVLGKRSQNESQYDPNRESARWAEGVSASNDLIRYASGEAHLTKQPLVVHVMDREGDILVNLVEMLDHSQSFVVRARSDRRMEPGRLKTDNKMFAFVGRTEVMATRTVKMVRRVVERPKKETDTSEGKKRPRRRAALMTWSETRWAELEIRAATCRIYGANGCHVFVPPEGIEVNVIEVKEVNAPPGVEPVCWVLLTDQPIETPEQIEFIVDCYRLRWLIEEWHKALKTGCGYEAHQFRSRMPYHRMLAIVMPIAVQMLRVRWFDRHHPDANAVEVFEPNEVEALRIHMHSEGKELSAEPSVREVFRHVARLGGHLPQNGEPGWLVLSAGLTQLRLLTRTYCAVLEWMQAKEMKARSRGSISPRMN